MDYFLLSQDALDLYRPKTCSLPVLRNGKNVYIAQLDFDDFTELYNSIHPDYKFKFDIWCQPLGSMKVLGDIDSTSIFSMNIFRHIQNDWGQNTIAGQCNAMSAICHKMNKTPIEFFNHLSKLKYE